MDWGFVLVVMAVYIGLGIALSWQDRVYRFMSFVWTGMLLGIVAALTLRITENNRVAAGVVCGLLGLNAVLRTPRGGKRQK